ncbi:hypothetical protein BU25DRAFT_348652 [Macroventuria anomochaeta]|uniref:Uncharacterized protein n=1 Tax=Macroventuria anomochaeta TaxID=301207 RepID=A0ACB6RR34_9PLEO|nr:uncharacterized protein BU25DRAFT_348652 [Macroventuria anomochaeta]KAF2624167.1 hypothetical protein BU25DRAFT_348652 [Macroventuria anomochaeta]
MGKKKTKGSYNDFLEDTRHSNSNNEIRTTLQTSSSLTRTISPPATLEPQSHQPNNTHNEAKPRKPPLTHFLCLPLVSGSNRSRISTALDKVRKDVEALTPVPPKAVRPVGTLHLTLGVMSLSPSQLDDATRHLQELDVAQLLRGITTQKIAESANDTPTVREGFGAVANPTSGLENAALDVDPNSLEIELRGLVPMHKPRQTSILYAEPRDASGRLLRFAESVRSGFEERGWVVKDERGLRLHATVLNTTYAKPKGRGREKAPISVRREDKGRKDGVDGDAGKEDSLEQQGIDGEAENEEKGKAVEERSKAHGPDPKSWMRFDATSLISTYADFIWAEDVRIDRVQICKMGAQKILHEETGEVVDEEYEVVAEKTI